MNYAKSKLKSKATEHEAQHGHHMSMSDRDPTAMNDHVLGQLYIMVCWRAVRVESTM